jgi:hypothetical protein
LEKVVITDLLPRERLLQLWEEFKRDRPDHFRRMIKYDGSDPEWVEAMRGWVKIYVLAKLEAGEIPKEPERLSAIQANAIGGSVIQLAKALHPKLKWLGWD